MVSQRKRFLNSLLDKGADRFPYFDLDPDRSTLKRWRREGLPRWKSFARHFNLELHHSVGLMLRSYPFYRKAPDLLQTPSAFKRHYDPDQRSRYPRGFANRCKRLRRQGHVLYLDASGGGLLQMLGVGDWESLVSACLALVNNPKMVEELVDRTTDFYCTCLKKVLDRVTIDYASFYEPIAANTGPIISPAMFNRFAIPGYRKVIDLLRHYHVPLRILCTTGGNLSPILPGLIDAGINCLWISNIGSSRMKYIQLRREFGSRVALIGGIDATALTRDKASIRKAVENTVPALLDGGAYLPCLDDRPRSNISFSHYRFYRQLLAEIACKG